MEEYRDYDKNIVYLPRQHMSQSYGGVYSAGHARADGQRKGDCRFIGGGEPVYPPARRILAAHGIRCEGHAARQMSAQDYEKYDLLIGMDSSNITRMRRICGGDPDGKMSRLLDHTCRPGDVADPWYTGEFETTWRDIEEGCRALLDELR